MPVITLRGGRGGRGDDKITTERNGVECCRERSRELHGERERKRERERGGAILDARIVRARRRRESRFHEKRKGRERVLARMRDVRDEAGPREMRSAAAGFL